MLLFACGGKQPAANGSRQRRADRCPVKDTRSADRDAPRHRVRQRSGPSVTACAVEDAKADLAAGKTTQKQYDQDTSSEVQHRNTEKFLEACKVPMSSRQVRVLEVCFKEETECDALLDCLSHLSDTSK